MGFQRTEIDDGFRTIDLDEDTIGWLKRETVRSQGVTGHDEIRSASDQPDGRKGTDCSHKHLPEKSAERMILPTSHFSVGKWLAK